MTAKQAQEYIRNLKPFVAPNKEDLVRLDEMKVSYTDVLEMPKYKRDKLNTCIDWVKREYNPKNIWLVRSQLEGYPVDEKTTQEMFDLKKKVFGKAKFSDWDFIVNEIATFSRVEQIAPLIKIDLFQFHHGGVRKLNVYKK